MQDDGNHINFTFICIIPFNSTIKASLILQYLSCITFSKVNRGIDIRLIESTEKKMENERKLGGGGREDETDMTVMLTSIWPKTEHKSNMSDCLFGRTLCMDICQNFNRKAYLTDSSNSIIQLFFHYQPRLVG